MIADKFAAPGEAEGPFIRVGRWRGENGRFILTTILCLLAAPVYAEPQVTLQIGADQLVEIMRLVDRQPIEQAPPRAFWTVQDSIDKALQGNPEAARAFLEARGAQ